jgi:hypothetical protein
MEEVAMKRAFGALCALTMLTACGSSQPEMQSGALQIFNLRSVKHFRDEYIQGTLRNTSPKKFQYVEVTINALDENGRLIEPVTGTHSGVKPNGTWHFKLRMTHPQKVDQYKLGSIVAW